MKTLEAKTTNLISTGEQSFAIPSSFYWKGFGFFIGFLLLLVISEMEEERLR